MITVTTFHYMGHPVRVVEDNSKTYFVIRDICNIIGLSNPNRALSMYTNNVPYYHPLPTAGGRQVVRLVGESDLEQFLRGYNTHTTMLLHVWLISTVYPSLRAKADRPNSFRVLKRKDSFKSNYYANR